MSQNRRRAPRRRAYDQAQDVRRTQTPRRRQKTGYREQTIEIPMADTRRPAQSNRRPDNSIPFPQQERRPRPQNGRSAGRSASGTGAAPSGRLRPTDPGERSPSRREGQRKRRMTRAAVRRRRIARRLAALFLLLCVIAAGAYMTVTMLFRISAIQVQTPDGTVVEQLAGYSSQSILQVLDVHLEENIFGFEPGSREAVLEQQFPLLESIRVVRKYPGTVVVQAEEAVPAYAVQSEAGWLTVSAKFKILSLSAETPQGLTVLHGGQLTAAIPGRMLEFAGTETETEQESSTDPLHCLNSLLQTLETYSLLADVTRIEFADTEQLAFLYQDRISVLLGTLNELDYKLRLAEYVLHNQDGKGCAATDTGLLDLSHLSASTTRKFRFAQGEPVLPSGYRVPSAAEKPAQTDLTEAPADPE